ncbi:hypothetical protein E5P52_05035 [Escherichia coli]|nr:hypothetical protein E5P52_05035 [Escherichia coli]TGX62855.1 hypothetical protein E5O93_03695 [Escherichia coli]
MAFSGLALLPLVALYPFRPFSFAGAIARKIVKLHQKPANRSYRSEASLLRGNRAKNFYVEIFSVDNDE